MNGDGNTEKSAMSDSDRNKIIKAAIVSAVASAGIGALVGDLKARGDRRKRLDAQNSKNTISVMISKADFMKDLMSPDEFRKAHGDPVASATASATTATSAGDVGSVKNDVLKGMGRKFNFFKKAEGRKGGVDKGQSQAVSGEVKERTVSEEKIDGRVVLRGENGKFVSATDPVAVRDVEKNAGIWHDLTNPSETFGRMRKAFTEEPVAYTAGAIGSVFLASLIADYINQRRRDNSKRALADARDAYVRKLEKAGAEKSAQSGEKGLPEWTGLAFGASFFAPFALAAVITNRVLENRKREKKKRAEMTNSYPEDPVILYKTSEGKDLNLSPEDILAAISIKSAMLLSADRNERELADMLSGEMGKDAQWKPLTTKITNAIDTGLGGLQSAVIGVRGAYQNAINHMTVGKATKIMTDLIKDEANNKYVHGMLKGVLEENEQAVSDSVTNMIKDRMKPEEAAGMMVFLNDPKNRNMVMSNLKTSKDVQNVAFNRMTDSKADGMFGPLREAAVNRYLKDKKNGWGLDENGILYKIVSWIANNLGLGRYFVGNHINSMFDDARKQQTENLRDPKQQTENLRDPKQQTENLRDPKQQTENLRDPKNVSQNYRQVLDQTKARQQEQRKQMLKRIEAKRQAGQVPAEDSGNGLRLRPVPSGSRVKNPASKPRARPLRPVRLDQTHNGMQNNIPSTPVQNASQNPT